MGGTHWDRSDPVLISALHCLGTLHSTQILTIYYTGKLLHIDLKSASVVHTMSPCREEFSLAALRLRHHDRSVFLRSPWWRGRLAFVVYRTLMVLLTVAGLVFLLVYHYHVQGRSDPWPIYLTNWSFTILTVYMIVAMVLCMVDLVSKDAAGPTTGDAMSRDTSTENTVEAIPLAERGQDNRRDFVEMLPNNDSLAWYHKVHWILHNTSICMALFVTTVYWTLDKRTVSPSSILEHIINSIIALLDLFVSGTPVRILNAVYPVAFATLYSVVFVIYWAAGGTGRDGATVIYALLDFSNNPGMATVFMLVFVLVGMPVFHLLTYGLYRLRELILTKTRGRNQQLTTLYSQPSNISELLSQA